MGEIAIQTATTEVSLKNQALAQLLPIESNIASMKTLYGSKVYDCTTTAGMAEAKADRVAIREIRYKIPHIEKDVTRQLNDLKKDIQTKASKLTEELLAIEKVSDDQIKAEEDRKAAIAAEKTRLAAEAQKILDDKILEISKLPMKCLGATSADIAAFVEALETRTFGGEFTGETLVRAETAKAEAVAEIRTMLARTIEAEEAAAKAEAERIEREKQEAIQREELARQQAELAEQKRLQDIEIAKQQEELRELQRKQAEAQKIIDEANAAEQKRLDDIRKADEQKAAEERAKIEAERQAMETKARAEQAEKDRIQREEEKKQMELAEIKAKEEEEARLAAEKAKALAEAKCETASIAFRKIINLCNNHDLNETELRAKVSIIAEGNL